MRVTNKKIYSKFKSPDIKPALKVRRLKLLENVVNTGGTGPEKKILEGKPGCRMKTGRQILRGGDDFKQ